MAETGQKMSKKQQSRIGEGWVGTTSGTVVYSSGSFNIAALAEQLELSVLSGTSSNCLINQITIDSREVRSGSLFIALSGSKSDGHDFIDQAVELNCSALLVEKGRVKREAYEDRGICVFETSNTREVYGVLAEILFAYPAKNMTMFGVTGTVERPVSAICSNLFYVRPVNSREFWGPSITDIMMFVEN